MRGRTDIGLVRQTNEDSFLVCRIANPTVEGKESILAIVADGVGGLSHGQVASRECARIIQETIETHAFPADPSILEEAIQAAHSHIQQLREQNAAPDGMGTTCTAAWLSDDQAYVAQVGDSRAYLLRGERFVQITEDQTVVQKLLRDGLIDEDEAASHPEKNVILQALGMPGPIRVDIYHVPLRADDVLLLCSDGLHGLVGDEEMVKIITMHTVSDGMDRLIDEAKQRGGTDNITAVVLKSTGAASDGREAPAKTRFHEAPVDDDLHAEQQVETRRFRKPIVFFALLVLLAGTAFFTWRTFFPFVGQP